MVDHSQIAFLNNWPTFRIPFTCSPWVPIFENQAAVYVGRSIRSDLWLSELWVYICVTIIQVKGMRNVGQLYQGLVIVMWLICNTIQWPTSLLFKKYTRTADLKWWCNLYLYLRSQHFVEKIKSKEKFKMSLFLQISFPSVLFLKRFVPIAPSDRLVYLIKMMMSRLETWCLFVHDCCTWN